MKILIDNGHGIDTKGKRSPDGRLMEYAQNRLLAGRIVTALQAHLPGHTLRTDYTDADPDLEKDFYLLRHTLAPAVPKVTKCKRAKVRIQIAPIQL